MRILGVDFGFKRIGLAVAETEPFVATPRRPLAASGKLAEDARRLAEIARKEDVSEIVLGLPIEESGGEGRMARIVRQLAECLKAEGTTVRLADERYSSVNADQVMREANLKGSERRKRKDGEAACRILEEYVHS
jgi:putative Holliday junction resolvase